MAVKCGACGKYVSSTGGATCTACTQCSIHYHKSCVGLADSSPANKDWVCPECNKKRIRKGDNSSTPVRHVSGSAQPTDSTGVSKPRPEETQTSSNVSENDFLGLRRELVGCMSELKEFRKELAELRISLVGINSRLDDFEQRIEAVEKRNPASGKVSEMECTIVQLKQELNDRDQETLLTDLEIGQLPEEKGENILHTVTVLSAKLGITLEQRDVIFAERVGIVQSAAAAGEEPRARRVVVRLARRDLRDQLLQAARVRRTMTAADAGRATTGARGGRIFINERLTRSNRQLFHRVREECRKLQWRFSWTKRGRIYARQADGKPAHPIRSDADFARVFGQPSV